MIEEIISIMEVLRHFHFLDQLIKSYIIWDIEYLKIISEEKCNCEITGVIGFMTFWGVRLESVSIITIIMSIGFAVDLSAHIGYAYVKSDGDPHTKAINALETIGWPVFMVLPFDLISLYIFNFSSS